MWRNSWATFSLTLSWWDLQSVNLNERNVYYGGGHDRLIDLLLTLRAITGSKQLLLWLRGIVEEECHVNGDPTKRIDSVGQEVRPVDPLTLATLVGVLSSEPIQAVLRVDHESHVVPQIDISVGKVTVLRGRGHG